ncbi:hypothetical protein DM060_01900 [Klebsiella pneumoniae]|uniref:hypothetical protein n=1 Tax=Klebsiella pneumoniae TaxID=573 RepID=UPI000DEE1442|nr:hypothetical protein [Klebsiella pneumoniae]MBS8210739.1 hypothetical protein [Klebsiella pneumoniae]NNG29978.1 hypothetical protein [Klebsiella pneumoniae]RCJ99775.1 hypothetical protein DM060_01900 [Klebsiella pneumoniae]
MKERGMIFNGEMVRAILDGRKTQTRRIMAPQPADDIERGIFPNPEVIGWKSSRRHKHGSTTAHFCPYGKPGDRIWVREAFRVHSRATDVATLVYKASERNSWTEQTHRVPVAVCNKPATPEKWTPSLHMPRWASRILLEITDVRVERLNAISQEDAQAEGMELTGWRPTYSDPDSGGEVMTPYDNFAELWSSIYGEDGWKSNPWVWVIEFKLVEGGAA